ncbi:DUF72 domain-containing protein [Streptomyces minutiscleroticus]|uniref:DUF72 domain-containing protein n=1 Tax=Streptomyces minutiscleroticus TaxID=68238 RepID=A0A918KU91_9ACTN|nr:DUF72 domain-containing protein [Streptomyces minutiscleroticus]GGX73635.1 hypothetical protein GCM10010358_30210 [Streptomyces minutiscleroticus]
MGTVLIGTCSWTDPALVSSGWYPRGHRDAEGRLRYYAGRFGVVEVDSTYYGLPRERNSTLWAERTPDGFRFDVKAFSLLTGHPTRAVALPADLRSAHARDAGAPELLDEVWRRFAGALGPLRDAGRLGTLLFQYPPWFAPGGRSEEALEECARRTAGWPAAVEFRHPGWWRAEQREATVRLLARLGLSAVAVDVSQSVPGAIPPVDEVTAPRLAVVRFHGRSASWGAGSKEDKFRHDYTAGELAEWLPRLRSMAGRADELHVLFNNCCGDAAVRAAETMAGLFSGAAHPSP